MQSRSRCGIDALRVWSAAPCLALLLPSVVGCQPAQRPHPRRGIAVLASSVGTEYPVGALSRFVRRAGFSPVVIDWAWITAHWERTDFGAVNRLIEALGEQGVETAAMYRPRFFDQEADIPIQTREGGSAFDPHGREPCLSSPEARGWGIAWGERILAECPGFGEIIVYNPYNVCECPRCSAARAEDPFAHYAAVCRFLAEARDAWRSVKPGVKLGVVFAPDLEFWARSKHTVDSARPFLYVREGADLPANIAEVSAVQDALPQQFAACLAKVDWGQEERVTPKRLAESVRLIGESGLPYFLWTIETLLDSAPHDRPAMCQALGLPEDAVAELLSAPGEQELTDAEIDGLFAELARAPAGAWSTPMDELLRQAKGSTEATRRRIVERATELVDNADTAGNECWVCLYILAGLGGPEAQATLIRVLEDSGHEVQRATAASALGDLGTPEATEALRMALGTEASESVAREVRKALRKRGVVDLPPDPAVTAVLSGARVALVLVKDFMRIENRGPATEDVEFKRYVPVVDGEQFVVARWIDAVADSGEELVAGVSRVESDAEANLIHTLHLDTFPADGRALVTITSLVARRERPAPQGEFPIPDPEAYPEEVRPYLQSTATVCRDQPEIEAEARDIQANTRDAYELAKEVAARMEGRSYLPQENADYTLPPAVLVLRYGGTCCGSAVCAASILRACGVPAQLTYCPAGDIHGVVRLYLNGYGWARMDATCGVGRIPFVQEYEHVGLVRLFDMPLGMEALEFAYAWPYFYSDEDGNYQFTAGGHPCPAVRFATGPQAADGADSAAGAALDGSRSHSWNAVLNTEPIEGAWRDWEALVEASRTAVSSGSLGEVEAVTARLPRLRDYVALARRYGQPGQE